MLEVGVTDQEPRVTLCLWRDALKKAEVIRCLEGIHCRVVKTCKETVEAQE